MKLVEVIRAVTTSDEAFQVGPGLRQAQGKLAIPTKDKAGFIVNRLLVPYMLDAIRGYEEGIGSVDEIDEAMKAGAGHPMGPLTLADFVGLDTLGSICDVLFDEFRERRFAQPPTLRKMLAAGWYGARVGKGFYDYSGEQPVPNPASRERPARGDRAGPRRRARSPPREGRRAGQAPCPRPDRAARRRGLVRRGGPARQLGGDGLGADGVVTGTGTVGGRTVAVMANDPTVKAGSWGPKTVEKIIRIQERALALRVPMVYLVDSAGARITDQVQMFPGRRGAGKIFHTEVKMSASSRRSACSSARAPRAARTSPRSATW
jgi:hypothetical protein